MDENFEFLLQKPRLSRYVIAYDEVVFGHAKQIGVFTMKITAIRSDRVYRNMMTALPDEIDAGAIP